MPKCDCCKKKFPHLFRESTGKFCQTCHARIFCIYDGRRCEAFWPEVLSFVPEIDMADIMEHLAFYLEDDSNNHDK